MLLTRIERQKRNPRRCNVYIDGTFAFAVTTETIAKFLLTPGSAIDPSTLRAIGAEEEYRLARHSALRSLSRRPRTEKEIRGKLEEEQFPPSVITAVINRLKAEECIDDLRFTRSYIHDAQLRRPTGRGMLRQRLRHLGVDDRLIREVLAETVDTTKEESLALDAAQQYLRRLLSSRKQLDMVRRRTRIIQMLQRRGFSWASISAALKALGEIIPDHPNGLVK